MTNTTPLFVYGSMLDEDVLEVVLGRRLPAVSRLAARLAGYVRVRLPDETYPVLAPKPGGLVHGAVLSDLGSNDFERVRFFESDEYEFASCLVELESGERLEATYCAENEVVPGASESWELAWWQTHHKPDYLIMIRHYMALYGRAELDEAEALWERLSDRGQPPSDKVLER